LQLHHFYLFASQLPHSRQALHSNVHLGLAYPLSTNGTRGSRIFNNTFSAHAISGVSSSETGFCGSGIASIVKDSVRGFIGSGVANVIGNKATGVQAAGLVNIVRNQTEGLTGSGLCSTFRVVLPARRQQAFANVATGNVYGAQVAGFSNTAQATPAGTGSRLYQCGRHQQIASGGLH
jgi:hypothetical protein